MSTCIENVGELLAAEISTDAGFADGVVAEVAADEVATLTTPTTLLITPVSVLLDVCIVVQRVAFLQRQTHQCLHHCLHLNLLLLLLLLLHCLKKCPTFDLHDPIAIISGRRVMDEVRNQMMLEFPPHLSSASALACER